MSNPGNSISNQMLLASLLSNSGGNAAGQYGGFADASQNIARAMMMKNLLNQYQNGQQQQSPQASQSPQGTWTGGPTSWATDAEGNPNMSQPVGYATDPEGNPIMQPQWQPSQQQTPPSTAAQSGGLWNWLNNNLFSLGGSN